MVSGVSSRGRSRTFIRDLDRVCAGEGAGEGEGVRALADAGEA